MFVGAVDPRKVGRIWHKTGEADCHPHTMWPQAGDLTSAPVFSSPNGSNVP